MNARNTSSVSHLCLPYKLRMIFSPTSVITVLLQFVCSNYKQASKLSSKMELLNSLLFPMPKKPEVVSQPDIACDRRILFILPLGRADLKLVIFYKFVMTFLVSKTPGSLKTILISLIVILEYQYHQHVHTH